MFVVFLVFLILMGAAVVCGISLIVPLAIGFFLFAGLSVRRGFTWKTVLNAAAESLRESFIVIWILLIIGCLTGMWRLSGTVAYFVTLGVSLIPPRMFYLWLVPVWWLIRGRRNNSTCPG